ncbi:MAG TPA: glycosyltransferase [Opitutaceae bacterium]|jgi:Tfp pilus assembly protein PilF|nr:glycosyltransferase [Opitutaceae bacterium]
MRLLFTTSALPSAPAWPALADEQIVAGPLQVDASLGGQVFSRRTPRGDYDLAAVLAALPPNQKPDAVACVVDGRTRDLPRNLAACPAVRLLLIGDTQNAPDGLPRLLDYARAEPFDRIVFTHGALDEPIFRAAGLTQVSWFPGLLCPVRDWLLPIIRQEEREPVVGFGAPTSLRHSAINQCLASLHRESVESAGWPESMEERLEVMGQTLAGVTPSERGEWNPAIFELLAAGGLVIAGGLGADAGLERIWPEGAPFVVENDFHAVAAMVRAVLDHPEQFAARRRAGAAWYDRFLGEKPRRAAFQALVSEGTPAIPAPAQPNRAWCECDGQQLRSFAAASAALQIAVDARERPTACVASDAPAQAAGMVRRFPRLRAVEVSAAESCDVMFHGCNRADIAATFAWSPRPEPPSAQREDFAAAPGFTVDRAFHAAWQCDRSAMEALETGHYAQAFELAKQGLASRPENPDSHLIIADLSAELGKQNNFEHHIKQFVKHSPDDCRARVLSARKGPGKGRRDLRRALQALAEADSPEAMETIRELAKSAPSVPSLHVLLAHILDWAGDRTGAIEAWQRAVRHDPNEDWLWFSLGLALWADNRREEAAFALRRAADHAAHEANHGRALAEALRLDPRIPLHAGKDRNLVICGSENCQKHGAGVMLKRFFGGHLDTVTLRPASYYDGVEEAGATHLYVRFEEFSPRALRTRLARLLAPYRIRRILCIPFDRKECLYALAAHELTGARMCAYVMDDRNVLVPENDDALLQDLFSRSAVRLAISPELQMAYTIKYDFDFDVMPPIVIDREARRINRWTPAVRPATRIALAGTVWTRNQYEQLLRFVVRSGVTVDWFGKPPPEDAPQEHINYMGWIPDEATLADMLTGYAMAVIPSGTLDGSEDNEWLTRLSLPSRIVFLLQTQTPLLVLGHKDTCASRHVLQLGIGRVVPYNHPNPAQVIAEMIKPSARALFLANAAKAADAFVMPSAGRWIWDSTDAGSACPAPFQDFLGRAPEIEIVWPPESAGKIPISHFEPEPALA